MSSISTGSGWAVPVVSGCSGYESAPFCLRIVVMCGSFLAFVAAPIINTNFASRSFAIVWSACSRACVSTLALVSGLVCGYNDFKILSSISFIYIYIFSSRSVLFSLVYYCFYSLVVALVAIHFSDV